MRPGYAAGARARCSWLERLTFPGWRGPHPHQASPPSAARCPPVSACWITGCSKDPLSHGDDVIWFDLVGGSRRDLAVSAIALLALDDDPAGATHVGYTARTCQGFEYRHARIDSEPTWLTHFAGDEDLRGARDIDLISALHGEFRGFGGRAVIGEPLQIYRQSVYYSAGTWAEDEDGIRALLGLPTRQGEELEQRAVGLDGKDSGIAHFTEHGNLLARRFDDSECDVRTHENLFLAKIGR